jgi:hypothetical protein
MVKYATCVGIQLQSQLFSPAKSSRPHLKNKIRKMSMLKIICTDVENGKMRTVQIIT